MSAKTEEAKRASEFLIATWLVSAIRNTSGDDAVDLVIILLQYLQELPFARAALKKFEEGAANRRLGTWASTARDMKRRNPTLTMLEAIAFHAPRQLEVPMPEFLGLLRRSFAQAGAGATKIAS